MSRKYVVKLLNQYMTDAQRSVDSIDEVYKEFQIWNSAAQEAIASQRSGENVLSVPPFLGAARRISSRPSPIGEVKGDEGQGGSGNQRTSKSVPENESCDVSEERSNGRRGRKTKQSSILGRKQVLPTKRNTRSIARITRRNIYYTYEILNDCDGDLKSISNDDKRSSKKSKCEENDKEIEVGMTENVKETSNKPQASGIRQTGRHASSIPSETNEKNHGEKSVKNWKLESELCSETKWGEALRVFCGQKTSTPKRAVSREGGKSPAHFSEYVQKPVKTLVAMFDNMKPVTEESRNKRITRRKRRAMAAATAAAAAASAIPVNAVKQQKAQLNTHSHRKSGPSVKVTRASWRLKKKVNTSAKKRDASKENSFQHNSSKNTDSYYKNISGTGSKILADVNGLFSPMLQNSKKTLMKTPMTEPRTVPVNNLSASQISRSGCRPGVILTSVETFIKKPTKTVQDTEIKNLEEQKERKVRRREELLKKQAEKEEEVEQNSKALAAIAKAKADNQKNNVFKQPVKVGKALDTTFTKMLDSTYTIQSTSKNSPNLDNAYNLEEIESEDSGEEESLPKHTARWAKKSALLQSSRELKVSKKACQFLCAPEINISAIFPRKAFNKRTSSAIWTTPPCYSVLPKY